MKPFDDTIPEENISPYQELASLLHQTIPTASITAEEQTLMLARVRARLRQTDDVSPEGVLSTPENLDSVFQSLPLRKKAPFRFSHVRRTLNMIAAVLVIGVITGASLFLFTSHHTSNSGDNIPIGTPVGPVKAPVTVRSQSGDLEASLQITAGPYFLSELLGVTVTFTNHSQKSVLLGGATSLNSCESAFSAMMTGGGDPHYNFPVTAAVSCPYPRPSTFAAGKTLTMYSYIPLTSSGQVIITTGAMVSVNVKDTKGVKGIKWVPSLLNSHWPIMHINVEARIPTDRTLSLQQHGSQISINAPSSARSHLVYYHTVACTTGGIINVSVDLEWQFVTKMIINEPGCSGINAHWTYAIGAPGYAIITAENTSQ